LNTGTQKASQINRKKSTIKKSSNGSSTSVENPNGMKVAQNMGPGQMPPGEYQGNQTGYSVMGNYNGRNTNQVS